MPVLYLHSMKSLLITRHAKSSWDNFAQKDFERPLNERGHRDAPEMAKRLLKKNIEIDAFISSTAVRALTTCTYFAKAYHKEKEIIKIPELYHASPEIFYTVINNVNDSFHTIALFSHNPGITAFVNDLTDAHIDNMPTCGVFAVNAKIKSWKDFFSAKKELWFFDYPKLIE